MDVSISEELETPCVKLCVVDPQSGYCIGCGRTRPEIAGWIAMSAAERREVMAGLEARIESLTRHRRRKGGARARHGSPNAA